MNQQDSQDTTEAPGLLDPQFADDLGVLSSHRQLIKAMQEHPLVAREIRETRHNPGRREQNLQALRDLARRPTDTRYAHPWDFSITALLLIIAQTDPQGTQEAAETAASVPRAHTAGRLAQSILRDAMSPRTSSPQLQRHLRTLIQQVNGVNNPDQHTGAGNMQAHNDQVRETLLATWQQTTLTLGQHQLLQEAGHPAPTPAGTTRNRGRRNAPPPGDQQAAREALSRILAAAESINHPERQGQPLSAPRETLRAMLDAVDGPKRAGHTKRDTPDAGISRHNDAMRDAMQDAWEDLAHATGNHTLAVTLSREQPILPLSHTPDPYRALGVAAYHAAAAAGRYDQILDSPETAGQGTPDHCRRQQLHQQAEPDARLAHRALYLLYNETAFHDPMVMEIRKRAQELHAWLIRARAQSAARLGLSTTPATNGDLSHHDIDHQQGNSTQPGPGNHHPRERGKNIR